MTVKADLPQFVGYLMTTTSYDQATSSMIMVAIDTNQNYVLCNYAMQSNVISNLQSPFAGEFYELECDNSVYASVKYGSVTALASPTSPAGLVVYPNPAQDLLNIQSDFPLQNVDIAIYDSQGKLILNPANQSFERFQLDIQTLSCGLYNIAIRDNKKIFTTTFIKE